MDTVLNRLPPQAEEALGSRGRGSAVQATGRSDTLVQIFHGRRGIRVWKRLQPCGHDNFQGEFS